MSLPSPSLSSPDAPRAAPARRLPAWAREPLLHFLILGGLLFALDHWLVGRSDDPRTIVMGAAVDEEARQTFAAARGREPNADELRALRQTWLQNEVLYREGLAQQLDRGDTAIRERVIFKALSVIDANTKAAPPSDETLRRWFEQQRARYDEPARLDFQEAVLAGESGEAAVRAFVQALNAGTPGDAKAGLRVFKGRPQGNIEQTYGPEFARALAQGPAEEWRALPSKDGWRAVRLEAVTPPRPADFAALRNVVLQDWTDATLAEQRTAAVRALTAQYRIRTEGPAR